MRMGVNEDYLAWTERHIVKGELCCTRLHLVGARLAAGGYDTTDTEKLLQEFEGMLADWNRRRQQILRRMGW
jgi:hypothetical protein